MADDDNGNVIDFEPARRGDEDEAHDPDALEWEDLCFIAERIIRTALAKIDWADLGDYARGLVHDDEDVKDVIGLMKTAKVCVHVGTDGK